MTSLISSHEGSGIMFRHAIHFIDDKCNLHDDRDFDRSFQEIYPEALELKGEHHGTRAKSSNLHL